MMNATDRRISSYLKRTQSDHFSSLSPQNLIISDLIYYSFIFCPAYLFYSSVSSSLFLSATSIPDVATPILLMSPLSASH